MSGTHRDDSTGAREAHGAQRSGPARPRLVPRPLHPRPLAIRGQRAAGEPPSARERAQGTRAGADRAGPGPNQRDDIRQSLWVRRPDLFYGQPNRGSHRAAFAEPLAPGRDDVRGATGQGRPAAEGADGGSAAPVGRREAGAAAAPGRDEDAATALRRDAEARVTAARELLPATGQGVPPAAPAEPAGARESKADRQVARQLARRPSPSSGGQPIARTGPEDVAAGTVRWEAAEPMAERGDPAADVTAPPAAERHAVAGRAWREGTAVAGHEPDRPQAAAGKAARDDDPGARGRGAGSGGLDAGGVAPIQDVGGAPVPLNAEAAATLAGGPDPDPALRSALPWPASMRAGHEVAPFPAGEPAGEPVPAPAGREAGAGGGEPGRLARSSRLDAAAEVRPRLRLRSPLRPRRAAGAPGAGETVAGGEALPGDRTTDATARTREAIRQATGRWEEQG